MMMHDRNKIEELRSALCTLDNTIFYREKASGAERADKIKDTDTMKRHIVKLFEKYAEHYCKEFIKERKLYMECPRCEGDGWEFSDGEGGYATKEIDCEYCVGSKYFLVYDELQLKYHK